MILLIGPSAVGKTEVANELYRLYHLRKVVTHTTRPMRINEVIDIDYHFVSVEAFLKMQKDNEFIETTFYNNHYYGTSKKELGENKVLIVDPHGKDIFLALKDPHIVIFYLKADNETRKKRMIERGDSLITINNRLEKDLLWFNKETEFGANYILDTTSYSLEELASKIYTLYTNYLKTH